MTRPIPRALLTERRCAECHGIFARMPDEPDRPYDPARCGLCLARLALDSFSLIPVSPRGDAGKRER